MGNSIKSMLRGSYKRGFSLLELLVVVGIFSTIVFFALGSFSTSRESLALNDTEALVLFALEESRNKSTTGVGVTEHGVYVEEDKLTMFAGNSYSGVGDVRYLSSRVVTDKTGAEIVFGRLSGNSSEETTITLTNNEGDTREINITYDGLISKK
jgi:prepilin-type N-terminal cleavage/methylation domain-containing protein